MLKPTKTYRRGEQKKHRQVSFRITTKEYKAMEKLARKLKGGNLSDLVRSVYLAWAELESKPE